MRYSGSKEFKIYSGMANINYLSENRNLDICIADRLARVVVLVIAEGKLWIRYMGTLPDMIESFNPHPESWLQIMATTAFTS